MRGEPGAVLSPRGQPFAGDFVGVTAPVGAPDSRLRLPGHVSGSRPRSCAQLLACVQPLQDTGATH